MIHILYLAAGQSRRYGANKLLDDFHGKPLYQHGLDAILTTIKGRSSCSLTVVTCWQEILTYCETAGIRAVDCPDSHMGVSYTIRAAIHSLGVLNKEDWLCFAVADQPYLTPESVGCLLDCTARKPLTACLAAGEISGNPVLFAASLTEELCALSGDKGGKAVMRRHPENHLDIPCMEKELEDIDVKTE